MIASVILTLVASAANAPAPAVFARTARVQDGETADEFPQRLEAAGSDVAKLWELHNWCKEQGKIIQARECLKKIVDLDANHADARKALGHHFYDNQWFKSYYELSEYKRAEDTRMRDEKGLVRFNDGWVPIADEPFLRMGMVKEPESGKWITKRELDRRTAEAKYEAEGWAQQDDLVWVPKDEQANWEKGLIKCGDKWLTAEEANTYHSQINQWWTLPSPNKLFEVWSTCPYNLTWWSGKYAEDTYKDLERAYGSKPEKPPVVIVLRSQDQYNKFAAGDQQLGLPATEVQGQSSVHYAYFAEALFLPFQPPEYAGTGVAVWNAESDQVGRDGLPDSVAYHAVRHAAALSYAEAIDPSLTTISRALATAPQQQFPFQAFWQEKKIPFWFRTGVAAYCERYFRDEETGEGYSPWWSREQTLDFIGNKGGPKPFQEIFSMQLDSNRPAESAMLILQSGMLVSFILDGKCKPVVQAHEAFKQALKSGGDTGAAAEALQKALIDHQEELSLFVKM